MRCQTANRQILAGSSPALEVQHPGNEGCGTRAEGSLAEHSVPVSHVWDTRREGKDAANDAGNPPASWLHWLGDQNGSE